MKVLHLLVIGLCGLIQGQKCPDGNDAFAPCQNVCEIDPTLNCLDLGGTSFCCAGELTTSTLTTPITPTPQPSPTTPITTITTSPSCNVQTKPDDPAADCTKKASVCKVKTIMATLCSTTCCLEPATKKPPFNKTQGDCIDQDPNCKQREKYCDNQAYKKLMENKCRNTCVCQKQ